MDADTPDLRKDEKAIIQRRAVPELLEGERVEAVAPLKRGKPALSPRWMRRKNA
jgi:hypothetical protein